MPPHPPGRPPLLRNVRSYEDTALSLPQDVLLDTSFVVRALVPTEVRHQEAADFLARLVDEEVVLVYNRLLTIELVEVAFKLAVVERHGSRGWPAKRNDGRVRRRAGRLAAELVAAWETVLSSASSLCIELHEVTGAVPAVMSGYGLASYDAVHAATAIQADVGAIVTVDAGFGALPQSVALLVDDTRVRSCRRRRGGR